MGIFLLLVVLLYGLVLFTGPRSASPKLGIDLVGGTRVTLVPQGEEPTAAQLERARSILERRVNGMGVSGAEVVTDGSTLVITVPGEDVSEARAVGKTSQLLFRSVAELGAPDVEAMPKEIGEMANRWVAHGVITPEQARASIDRIIEAINADAGEGGPRAGAPKVDAAPPAEPANSIEAAERRRETTAMLRRDRQSDDPTRQASASTLMQCAEQESDPLAGTDDPAKPLVACGEEGRAYVLNPAPSLPGRAGGEDAPRLTGNEIDTGKPINGGYDSQAGEMVVSFAFRTGGGAEAWSALTNEYQGRQVAITLDSRVISAPVVRQPTGVGEATQITGDFTQQEAQELANNLRYGALPLSFAGENGEQGGTTTTIPASLGAASLQAGLIAGLIGLVLVALFVLFFYRLYGLISLFTLFCAGLLVYGALVLLGRWIGYSLDLSGIAGLIIGLGATADSFVVMYERIKDEVRDGHSFRSATRRGWDRAKRTIITGNMVTLIGSVVVYFLAIGEVRGFAFTLGMTTVFDLVVTFLVTAPLMLLASVNRTWARPAANGMARVFRVAERDRRAAAAAAQSDDTESSPAENKESLR